MPAQPPTSLECRGLAAVCRAGLEADRAVAALARLQLGVVTRRQVLALGLTRHAVEHRRGSGLWTSLHRGVYSIGPPGLVEWSGEMAALLWVGEGAVLDAASALGGYGLRPKSREIHVAVQQRDPEPRPGIRLRRCPALDRRDVRWLHGMPAVAPALALLQAAPDVTARELEQAIATGYRRHVVRRSELEAVIERNAGRPGGPALRAALAWERGPVFTRSQIEELGLSIIRSARLPSPEVNHPHGRHEEVDFIWPDHRFILEVDGHDFHSLRPDRERDYERDDDNQHAGFHVTRATGRQLRDEPFSTLARIVKGLNRHTPCTEPPPHPMP